MQNHLNLLILHIQSPFFTVNIDVITCSVTKMQTALVISNFAISMSRVELLTNERQAQCIYKVNFVNTGGQHNLFSLKLEVLQSIVLHLFKNTGKLDCKTSPLLLSEK